MSRIGIAARLNLLVGLSLLVLAVAMIYALRTSGSQLLEERRALLQTVDEVALSIVTQKFKLVESGALSDRDARAAALAELKEIRYGDNGYVWVNDLNQIVLMHPIKPELDGTDATNIKDPNGTALFVEFVKVAKAQKSGFVDYYWPKPGVKDPVAKLSHVTLFQPWGWVIGNGVYIDDLNSKFWENTRGAVTIAAVGVLLLVAGAMSVIRSVTKPILRLRSAMDRIAAEDFTAAIPDTDRRDEVGAMARTLGALRDSVNARVQVRLAQAEEQRQLLDQERSEAERLRAVHAGNLDTVVRELGAGLARLAGEGQDHAARRTLVERQTFTHARMVAQCLRALHTHEASAHRACAYGEGRASARGVGEFAQRGLQQVQRRTGQQGHPLRPLQRPACAGVVKGLKHESGTLKVV